MSVRTEAGAMAEIRRKGGPQDLDCAAQVAGWTTASASDAQRGGTGITPGMSGSSLVQMSQLAGWATPTSQDSSRGAKPPRPWDTGIPLTQQISGINPDGFPAGMASTAGYQLNPFFSLWPMAFPPLGPSLG